MQAGQTLVLVDGSSLAFRSFYALLTSGLRRSRDGMATWAILGFLNSLFDLVEQRRPDGLAISFDMAEPTFRKESFAEYKANRTEMPDDLSVQWPLIKHAVSLLNVPVYEIAGFEADDVIGTVARQAQARGIKVQIFTGDYDSFQLVEDEGEAVRVLVPVPKRHEIIVYGRQQVFEKLCVWPEQVTDYKGLCGDTSDNIPGVRGIGPKTAVQLLTQYGNMENIYAHIDEIKGALKQKLIDGKESAFQSKALATMRFDVPLEFDFEHCSISMPKVEELAEFLIDLEFKQMANRLPKILGRFSENGEVPSIAALAAIQNEPGGTSSGGGGGRMRGGSSAPSKRGAGAATAVLTAEPQVQIVDKPTPSVITTEEDLLQLVAKIEQFPALAVSLETQSGTAFDGDIVGYALAWAPGLQLTEDKRVQFAPDYDRNTWKVETAYVPMQFSNGGAEYLPAELVHAKLKPLLENPSTAIITHNAKATLNALSLVSSTKLVPSFDPMLASYIINPDDKNALKDLAERLLGYSTVRTLEQPASGRKQLTINFAAVDKIASCGADDARIALELTRYYIDQLNHDQQYLLYEIDLPLTCVLARMEQNGVALDTAFLAEYAEELTRDLNRLEAEIFELAGEKLNINSPIQLQKVLFDKLQLKTKARTKTGFSTDASVLEGLRDQHEIIPKILEFRQLSKLRSTYVEALPARLSQRDNRLHGEFNMTTTATGRLSSSNPNLQNIPIKTDAGQKIRRAFIAGSPDSVIMSADYSQIELRLLGHMSADPILRDAFVKDQDIHARTSGEIFDIPIEQVQSHQRRIGKTLNFALVYGQGPMATAQELGISVRDASAFIEKYFSRLPNVRGFMDKTVQEAKSTNYVQTLWGRRRYFKNLNDRSDPVRKADERAAVNAPIQGSAADLMRIAMIRLDQELAKRNLKTKLILQVHDELVLEVPRDEIEIATTVIREAMEQDQPFTVPLKVDVGVGNNWMEAK